MDLRLLILFLPLICLQIRAEDSGWIVFLDGPKHQFLRTHPSDGGVAETSSMSLSDVGAAISVLLGFSPPASLSADSSSKLNEVLSPNPFNRPRAVLMLEVEGIDDQQPLTNNLGNARIGNAIRSKVLFGSAKSEIQLPGEAEISVISLDESFGSECDAACMDKQVQDLASWLGGSYEPRSGELSISLASGSSLKLHMSKEADRKFVISVVSLVRNVRRAMEMHGDFSPRVNSPAELIIGSFSGLKDLQEKYGHGDVSQQGIEVFLATLTKLFVSLEEAYQGQLVGVYFFNDGESNVKLASRPSSRLLGETVISPRSILIAEVVLVRLTLAWITGIILLISTLLGIYYLVNMPITRDTLLYSNVKLD